MGKSAPVSIITWVRAFIVRIALSHLLAGYAVNGRKLAVVGSETGTAQKSAGARVSATEASDTPPEKMMKPSPPKDAPPSTEEVVASSPPLPLPPPLPTTSSEALQDVLTTIGPPVGGYSFTRCPVSPNGRI